MNLCIDIGNTRTKLGIFENEELTKTEIWEALHLENLKPFLYNHPVRNIILSSVKVVDENMEVWLDEHYFYLQLTTQTSLPFKNKYETPQTLGKDRLAAVAGAYYLYPGEHCLVIDAGTCITYDFLHADGSYLGGNISPGLEMRLQAMHTFTAKLPKVAQQAQKGFIGKSTETAIRFGGQLGTVLEMQGFIDLFREKFSPLNVLLTGGDKDFFANQLKTKIFANQNLVLVGLNQILNYNVGNRE